MEGGLGSLEYVSPVAGKIQSINYSPDENGGDSEYDEDNYGGFSGDDQSQPLMVISQTNAFRVKCIINEENLRALSEGDPVTIRSRMDDSTWEGTVTSIQTDNPEQDQDDYYGGEDSEMTKSSKYPFYVDLENTEGLMLGQHVFVELAIDPAEFLPEDTDAEDGLEDGDFAEEDFEDDFEDDFDEDYDLNDDSNDVIMDDTKE